MLTDYFLLLLQIKSHIYFSHILKSCQVISTFWEALHKEMKHIIPFLFFINHHFILGRMQSEMVDKREY